MGRSDRLFILGAVVAVMLAVTFGAILQPEQPKLAGDSGYREQAASYRAGGSGCEPAKIHALPVRLRQGKADACAEAQEQHREAANNLIENRRAAIAAEASTSYTAAQARIEAWGAAIGLLTLVAAVAAAFFAKRAAEHTEAGAKEANRSANLAESGLEATKEALWKSGESNRIAREQLQTSADAIQRELRPYVVAKGLQWTKLNPNSRNGGILFQINWENAGQTPAFDLAINSQAFVLDKEEPPGEIEGELSVTPLGPRSTILGKGHVFHAGAVEKAFRGEAFLYLAGIAEYTDGLTKSRRATKCCYRICTERDPEHPDIWSSTSYVRWSVAGPYNGFEGESTAE